MKLVGNGTGLLGLARHGGCGEGGQKEVLRNRRPEPRCFTLQKAGVGSGSPFDADPSVLPGNPVDGIRTAVSRESGQLPAGGIHQADRPIGLDEDSQITAVACGSGDLKDLLGVAPKPSHNRHIGPQIGFVKKSSHPKFAPI